MGIKQLFNDRIIRIILAEVTELTVVPLVRSRVVKTKISSPPTWLVASMMSEVMGFKLHDNEDKSYWQIHLMFRGFDICLRDWKGWSWSIDIFDSGSTIPDSIYDSLIQKLASACKRYENSILKPMWNHHLQSDDFMIRNTFRKSYGHYWHLRELSEQRVAAANVLKEEQEKDTAESFDNLIAHCFKKASQYSELNSSASILCNAAILFFYASTENIFDIGFSFLNNRKVNYLTFRSMDWAERFKTSLPEFVSQHQKIYDAMYRGLKDQRHQIAHGFGGEESGLFFVPGIGYRPITYTRKKNKVGFPNKDKAASLVDDEIANLHSGIFEVFDSFEKTLRSTPKGHCIMRFADSFLDIPLSLTNGTEMRQLAEDPAEFEHWMQHQEYWLEKAINGER